jgi:hypothetical protein
MNGSTSWQSSAIAATAIASLDNPPIPLGALRLEHAAPPPPGMRALAATLVASQVAMRT